MPEQKLALAVLEDAIACYQKHLLYPRAKGRTLFREAEEWITSLDEDWIFSFENVCALLGLDSAYLRTGLRRWSARMKVGVKPMTSVPLLRAGSPR